MSSDIPLSAYDRHPSDIGQCTGLALAAGCCVQGYGCNRSWPAPPVILAAVRAVQTRKKIAAFASKSARYTTL
jgi:hypothetical protein